MRSLNSPCLGVVDVDRKPAARDPEYRSVIEETGETLCVQSSTSNQHLQVRPEACDVFDQPEQYVCVQCPLVSLINNDHTKEKRKSAQIKSV